LKVRRHVPDDLISACTDVLSRVPICQRRPNWTLNKLIHGLNTIYAGFAGHAYDNGLPQPSVIVKELTGIVGLCNRASRTGNRIPVSKRIGALRAAQTDSYALITFAAATHLGQRYPTGPAHSDEVAAYIEQLGPDILATMAQSILDKVDPLAASGQGGARHEGALAKDRLLEDAGLLFERLTGRKPGYTYDPNTYKLKSSQRYSGLFVDFAKPIFAGLGLSLNGKQIAYRKPRLDMPEWRRPKRKSTSGAAQG
jgi:hypothetical protein